MQQEIIVDGSNVGRLEHTPSPSTIKQDRRFENKR